ncbi:hypothetical protein B0H19DRAFT_1120920 [Mycena capillaripes]|nr:hypothetical protein B0H19DRAFT_1120920 [Mycena capillaripes]
MAFFGFPFVWLQFSLRFYLSCQLLYSSSGASNLQAKSSLMILPYLTRFFITDAARSHARPTCVIYPFLFGRTAVQPAGPGRVDHQRTSPSPSPEPTRSSSAGVASPHTLFSKWPNAVYVYLAVRSRLNDVQRLGGSQWRLSYSSSYYRSRDYRRGGIQMNRTLKMFRSDSDTTDPVPTDDRGRHDLGLHF